MADKKKAPKRKSLLGPTLKERQAKGGTQAERRRKRLKALDNEKPKGKHGGSKTSHYNPDTPERMGSTARALSQDHLNQFKD